MTASTPVLWPLWATFVRYPSALGRAMDSTPLAAAAASALIAAMTTDAWEQARAGVVGMWRRVHPDRAGTIHDELAQSRHEALEARENDDVDSAAGLVADWQRRLRRLLEADPAMVGELQRLLDDVLSPAVDPADRQRIDRVVMKAQASGHGRVFQAGRDMRISGQ
jgi:hypothetical protein